MDIRKLILHKIDKQPFVKISEVILETGFSREYVNRIMRGLREEGKVVLIGKANKAVYVKAEKKVVQEAKNNITVFHKTFKNKDISEDTVLDQIKRDTGIFDSIKENVSSVVSYAFTEILNNAIEHSRSKFITIKMNKNENDLQFKVLDGGIGIFNNIKKFKHLKNDFEAIQDLLKGKQTTAPAGHSGEGIFFTSKMADALVIESSEKKLIFNNTIEDLFIQDIKYRIGTRVVFTISLNTSTLTESVFREYTSDSFEFDRTRVAVRLYKMGSLYISRSQARRIMSGLEKFKVISLDFKNIKSVGQGFADEVFRVWKNHNAHAEIVTENSNENIDFMISRARGGETKS